MKPVQSNKEHALKVEGFKLFELSLTGVFIATLLCLVAVYALLAPHLSPLFLLVWTVAQLVLTFVRWRAQLAWKNSATDTRNVDARQRTATVHALISGVLWGALGYAAVIDESAFVALSVVMLLTGLVAGANAIISHLPVMYALYVVPMLLPAAVRFHALRDIPEMSWASSLIVGYLVISIIVCRASGSAVRQSIALRLENRELVDSLMSANERTESALDREMQANVAKSRFLAAASHDLRQPLHSLRLLATTLSDQTVNGPHERVAGLIDRSVGALGGLFDAILDISRLDAGALSPSLTVVPAESLCERLAEEIELTAAEKGLDFIVRSPDVHLHTDPVLLERLLRNLLSNAVRYTSAGHVGLAFTAIENQSVVRIEVSDTGPGIPEADRARVFDEFVQLGNPGRDRSQGIGLGLSIVRRIANLLDVELLCDERPGGGLIVNVVVPMAQSEQIASAVAAPNVFVPAPEPRELTVLAIDDDEDVRVAMETFLENRGLVVIAVDSASSAITVLDETQCRPDAIVCDYRLADHVVGSVAVAEVRAHLGSDVPAILISGEVGADQLDDIRHSGLPMLHKPCDPDELIAMLLRISPTAPPISENGR